MNTLISTPPEPEPVHHISAQTISVSNLCAETIVVEQLTAGVVTAQMVVPSSVQVWGEPA